MTTNIRIERESKSTLVPTPELIIGVYDTLTDWQIDAILAGTRPPPGARVLRASFGKQDRSQYRCTHCGKKGHNRSRCG